MFEFAAGWVKSSPPVERAVLETVEALRKQGHECVEFELPNGMSYFVQGQRTQTHENSFGCSDDHACSRII